MQACSRRRALSGSNAGGNGGRARLRKSQSDSPAVEKRKRSNFAAAADKEQSGGSSAVQLKKSLSDLPISRTEREMFVDKEMDKNDEKPRSVEEEEEEQIPVSVEDEKKNQSLESLLSMDVVEKGQIVLVADRNVGVKEEEEEEEEEESKMQCVENVVMNLESEAQPHELEFVFQSVEIEEEQEEQEEQQQEQEEEGMCEVVSSTTTRMQSIEDLVMWKDASRSALVFGFGTFVLLSSSYAEEVHFSMISSSSYVGLVYLAIVFLCKSFIRRGEELQCDESCTVVEEEDAIWLIKMLLPYINELLLKLKTLFSGDPSTTLKLAGVLFVMARCGSKITIWSLVRLTFFGVFIVPKACCSYSSQLTKLGRFWLDRVRDGWESCTHKKAVAVAIFCVIWNISSTIARVWSFFMLVVAVKLYQQSAAENNNNNREEEEEEEEEEEGAGQKEGHEDSMAGQSQQLKLE